MALTLGDNFSYQGAKPLDARLKYDTLANMKAVADATMYEGCLAYCEATDKTYQWKSTNTVDADTGKWREFETGGASALNDLTDTNISTPTDGQVLQYDGTNDEWVNGDALDTGGTFDGYGISVASNDPMDFIRLVNTVMGTTAVNITNESIFNNKTVNAMAVIVAPTKVAFWIADKPFKLQLQNVNDNLVANIWRDNTITMYSMVNKSVGEGIDSIYPSGGVGWFAGVVSDWNYTDATRVAKVFATSNVVTDEPTREWAGGYSENKNKLVCDVGVISAFYTDNTYTTVIPPTKNGLYKNELDGKLYLCDGSNYNLFDLGISGDYIELSNKPSINGVTLSGNKTTADLSISYADLTNKPTISDEISDLSDVTLTSLENGDTLKWDATNNKWVNGQGGGGASALEDLTDTDITSPANGDVLKYDATNDEWVNSPITSVNDVEITLADYNDLPEAQKNNGLNYFITDGQNAGYIFSVQKAVLAAGATSVQFNIPTTGEPLLTLYTSDPNVQHTSCTISNGVATYYFTARSSAVNVYLKIEVF